MAVATRARPSLGRDDALLLEVADHARREADHGAGWADARQLVLGFVDSIRRHDAIYHSCGRLQGHGPIAARWSAVPRRSSPDDDGAARREASSAVRS